MERHSKQASRSVRTSKQEIRQQESRRSRRARWPTGLLSFFPLKGRVERHSARSKIIGTNIPARLGCPMDTVHSDVFPFDRQRAPVADVIEGDDDLFEADISMSDRTKIPVPPVISKIGVPGKYADLACAMAPPDIFHVCMVDTVAEIAQEFDVADSLIAKMRWIVIKTEPAMVFDRFHRTVCRGDVKGNLCRVHFQGEVHIELFKSI